MLLIVLCSETKSKRCSVVVVAVIAIRPQPWAEHPNPAAWRPSGRYTRIPHPKLCYAAPHGPRGGAWRVCLLDPAAVRRLHAPRNMYIPHYNPQNLVVSIKPNIPHSQPILPPSPLTCRHYSPLKCAKQAVSHTLRFLGSSLTKTPQHCGVWLSSIRGPCVASVLLRRNQDVLICTASSASSCPLRIPPCT